MKTVHSATEGYAVLQKTKPPIDCDRGFHSDTYESPLIVTNVTVKRCVLCNDIPSKREYALWKYESDLLEELKEVRPVALRFRMVRERVDKYREENGFTTSHH